jgi:hypothetical protein
MDAQIVEPLSAISSNFEILVNQNQSILGQKGLPPYTYEKVSGVGSINPSGNYISNSSGSVVLKIKDSLNQEILVSGQVYSILNIAQSNYSITTANQITFNPTGGKSPYNFIKTSGVGEVSNLGVYTSNLVGNAQITISDSLGQSVSVSISVNTSLSIQSGNCSYAVPEQNNCQVQSSGGIGTRTYSVDKGVINSTTGEFYGVCSGINSISEQSTVTVSDSYGNQSSIVLNYPCVFSSCNQIKAEVPSVVSGQFWIDTDNDRQGDSPFLTFCDHDYEKGGWNLVAKYGNTSNNLRHWFVTSYGNLSLDTTFPNDMQIASYANKLVRRASEIKVNFNSSLNSYYTINQLTTNKNNLWNNTSSNLLIGYIGVRPTGFNTTPYAPGQPVRSHHGTYGGANGSGLTSGLSSDLSLDTVANCATYCAYRLPGIGATPAAAWGLQENNLHVYVKELYNKYGVSCADAKNRNLLNQSGTTASGNYWIDPDGANIGAEPYTVFCDMVGNNSTMNATGGEITYSGDYKIHTFRNIGTSSFSITQGSGLVEALVVAGGGGGGGAGGVLTTTSLNLSIVSPNYSVVVGQGGPSGGSVCSTGNNGSDSSFAGLVAKGGGAGAAGCGGNNVGFSGGSGGAGTNGQGFNGGSTSNLSFAGGAGGSGIVIIRYKYKISN